MSLSWCLYLQQKATNAKIRPGNLNRKQIQGHPSSKAEIVKLKPLIYWQAHPQGLFNW